MKVPMNILRLSAGKIDDGGMLYANAIILDENIANQIEKDRIDVGQQHAKVKINTSDENKLAKQLAQSGLIPNVIMCDVSTIVKKAEITMQINGFEFPK